MKIEIIDYLRRNKAKIVSRREGLEKIKRSNAINSQIRYYNFYDIDWESFWFTFFLKTRTHFSHMDKQVAFFSNFGERECLNKAKGDIRIFFTGENLRSRFLQYGDNMLNDPTIDLALGFDYFEDKRYMRFPLWMHYMFEGNSSDEEICQQIEKLRHPSIGERERFCAMVASHDFDCVREKITKEIATISQVSCGGKFMHNDETLKSEFNDNKKEYLSHFVFNICPENTNAYGYVTEKIFESIVSGCIPIYWGSYNDPEPQIINKDAVIFFEPGKDNSKQITFIEELWSHPKLLSEFQHQDRLKSTAEDEILSVIYKLADKLDYLIKK